MTGTQTRERHCIDTLANVSQGQVACDIIELIQNEMEECETDLHRKFILFIHYQIYNHNLNISFTYLIVKEPSVKF